MGKISSSLAATQLRSVPAEIKANRDIKRIVARWKITDDELSYLYTRFVEMDLGGKGSLDIADFFSFARGEFEFHLHDTVYRMIVLDPSKPLTFPEWMVTIFAFCFQTKLETIEQIFLCFDAEQSGKLSFENIENLLVAIHGDNVLFCREIINQLQLNTEEKSALEFDDFVKAVDRLPMLLWPVFKVQNLLRYKVLGSLFHKIDARSGDIDLLLGQAATTGDRESGWTKKKEQILTYLCGWPCCRMDPAALAVELDGKDFDDEDEIFNFFQAGDDEVDKELALEMRKMRQQQAALEMEAAQRAHDVIGFRDVEEDEYRRVRFWD